MGSILAKLPKQTDPNVLIGFDTADDAGVYQLAPDLALVQTVDFFTPVVDDPYTFGQIAAVNSLSDIYAMGGRPVTALSIVGFPNSGRDPAILEAIVAGGLAKMQEAGCAVIGGHSIADDEMKFGYAVTGVVDPKRILANAGAQAGDRLVLTKRLGTGVISTALKAGKAADDWVRAASDSMLALNRAAGGAAVEFGVRGATDITGFGLLGHAHEMAHASKVSLVLDTARLEFLPGAVECSRQGFLPAGLKRNAEFVAGCVRFTEGIPEEIRNLLYDPQTSGGLLLPVSAAKVADLLAWLGERGVPASEIGEMIEKTEPLIQVQ